MIKTIIKTYIELIMDYKLKIKKATLIGINSLFILSLSISTPTYSNLIATTANIIHGFAPALIQSDTLDSLEVKLYLTLDDENVFELTPSNHIYYIGANTQFGQIKAKVETNTTELIGYFTDSDGDQVNEANVTTLSYSWKKNGAVISSPSSTDYINTNACSTGATTDNYVLTVNGEVKAKTKYGVPNESDVYSFTRTFTIDANNGVCFLRPADMAINNGSTGISSISNQFDASVFQTTASYNTTFNSRYHTGGFFYDSGFPTTAFEKAMFRIVLSDGVYNASNYAFSILGNPSQISLQSNNQVIFNSKPENKTYYVKITKASNNFIAFYPIKLESKNSWFTGYRNSPTWTFNQWESGSKTVNGAKNPAEYCAVYNKRLPRLRDLGNFTYSLSPYLPNSIISPWPGDHSVANNGFTRAMSSTSNIENGTGGLLTEWGRVRHYDSTSFSNWWYWTSDYRDNGPNDTKVRFAYGASQGNIIYARSTSKGGDAFYVMCVEDL